MSKKTGIVIVIAVILIGFIAFKLVRRSHAPVASNEPIENVQGWESVTVGDIVIRYPKGDWRASLAGAPADCTGKCLTEWKEKNASATVYPIWQEGADDAISFVVPSKYNKKTCEAFASANPEAAVYCPDPVAYYYFYTNSQHPDVLTVFDQLVKEASN